MVKGIPAAESVRVQVPGIPPEPGESARLSVVLARGLHSTP